MLFARLIVMGFKLLFEYFPDPEILWPANSAVPGKGQGRAALPWKADFGSGKIRYNWMIFVQAASPYMLFSTDIV